MPIQRVAHWEEKARNADSMAGQMTGDAKQSMLDIAELYRQLARQTAKLVASESQQQS